MTEEELKQKAEDYATKECNEYYGFETKTAEDYMTGSWFTEYECTVRWNADIQAYIDGVKSRDKEIEELKAQIEDIANINIKAQTIIEEQKRIIARYEKQSDI